MICEHDWKFICAFGEDAPGKSLDTISHCQKCGAVKHDYAHGGGQTSPNYPMIHKPDSVEASTKRLVEHYANDSAKYGAEIGKLRKEIATLTASLANRDSQLASVTASLAEARERLAVLDQATAIHFGRDVHAYQFGDCWKVAVPHGISHIITGFTGSREEAIAFAFERAESLSRAAALAAKGDK